jgi:hypothetical protein
MEKISRRTVLRGLGGLSMGLPWLEAMGQSRFNNENIRLGFIQFPSGVAEHFWTPEGEGSAMKLSKSLAPLAPIVHKVNVHTGLAHNTVCNHVPGIANFLSGVAVKKGDKFGAAKSADQVAADYLGKDTYLPSLELSMKPPRPGKIDEGYLWALGAYISWYNETTPVPRELVPENAYARLFKGTQKSVSTKDESKSILDFVKDDTIRLKRSIGREDLDLVDQYFTNVRYLEKRMEKLARENMAMPRTAKTPPKGIPNDFQTHAELMIDIMVLAMQTNRTKVVSFMFGIANSSQRFDFVKDVGNEMHHSYSHHNNNPEKIKCLEAITRYHVSLYSAMLQKMDEIKEGDKTLLDNSLILMGSGLWEGDRHSWKQKPLIVAGKGGGSVKTGLHQIHNQGTPMNNLLLGMLKTAGCPVNKFGDSNNAII